MKSKKIAFLGIMAAFALTLSYLELLLPPISAAVPGIKMGLANIVVIFVLYRFGSREAAAVSAIRIIVAALLFGSLMSFLYSIAGAALSFIVMLLLKQTGRFSEVGVSAVGGITHNAAQILVAAFMFDTPQIWYYMPILALTGIVSGILVGVAGAFSVKRLEKIKF